MRSIVIYGARGWMGKSAISVLRKTFFNDFDLELTLIGSKNSQIDIDGVNFSILDPDSAKKSIKDIDVFLNAAFLRREFLKSITHEGFVNRNNELSEFAFSILDKFKPETFINLSSGAAARDSLNLLDDPYGFLKQDWEKRFAAECSSNSVKFINCRIYSLTGRFINEFENLAISQFIQSALNKKKIFVNSEKSIRTYVDSETLCELLFSMAFKGVSASFDSGGVKTTMGNLANSIKSVIDPKNVELDLNDEKSEDYFGDYDGFQELLGKYEIKLESLEQQIVKTLVAFT